MTDYNYIYTPEPPRKAPQYRKRIKGFAGMCSWDSGADEFTEIPDECPNGSTIGCGVVAVDEYNYY